MALLPEDITLINQLIGQYFSANLQAVKLSTLPLASTLEGLHTMGVDASNNSVRVSLQFVKDATTQASDAANLADQKAAFANGKALLAIEAAGAANTAAAATKPLRFIWDETSLGLKFEGDPDFVYTDLKGATGNSLEFAWNGTQLGVRVEGQPAYTEVELGGKDAYQIALALDPTIGTEEEWIQSLKQPALDAAEAADAARLAIQNDLAAKAAHGYGTEPQKTLKEVDDSVSQLAGDVSLLDAVQGAKIKDIENVLSTANIGQSAKISVTGTSPLLLPKNAANSGMSVKMEGLTQDVGGVITHFEPTGRIRSVDKNGLNPTALYLTAPELRSNGTVKDEIRKGANGYEHVKRVGVGTSNGEIVVDGGFDDPSKWIVSGGTSNVSGGTLKIIAVGGVASQAVQNKTITAGRIYKYSINALQVTGTLYVQIGNTLIPKPINTAGVISGFFIAQTGGINFRIVKDLNSNANIEIDNFSIIEYNPTDGAATSGGEVVIVGSLHYTLATQIITPISHGGILNSAENGTVYHEPSIADAGVYSTKMDILLTDYPIATLEEIIKHVDGVDTYLDVATAVIAGDGLSFTHPSLASGDLVLFTYAFSKETTNGNITATFYDSNVVKIDTVTGKAYRINEVVTNGVLTRTLTEV